jgi:hypothetical protein
MQTLKKSICQNFNYCLSVILKALTNCKDGQYRCIVSVLNSGESENQYLRELLRVLV